MNRLSVALIAAVSTIVLNGVAAAADMPVKAPAAVVAQAYNWTGWYAGINAGWGWMNAGDTRQVPADPATAEFVGDCFTAGGCPNPMAAGKANGFQGGGQFGYNWQLFPAWVVGFEADLQWSDVDASEVVQTSFPGRNIIRQTSSTSLDWYGTVRGRLGFLATPTTLLYGTGGLAYGRVKRRLIAESTDPVTGFVSAYAGQAIDVELGWVAGGGFDWAVFPNVILGLEYLYMNLGERTFSAYGTAGGCLVDSRCNIDVTSGELVNQTVRARLNFRF